MICIDTIPEEINFFELCTDEKRSLNRTKIRVFLRAHAKRKITTNHTWYDYEIDLTNYYEYCKLQDIDVLGHTLDRIGNDRNNYYCGITFYFDSYAGKACFVLKFL